MKVTRQIFIPDRWCVHSYYILCPYAPDGSGRLLATGVDLNTRLGKVYVMASDGSVMDEFGENLVESNFYHTGFWQTWSPDCRYVYYQSGSLVTPRITRHELATGREITINGDSEGAPPHGEPIVSGLLGMLYAAGYGYGVYNPAIAPVPFEERDKHGVFEYTFEPPSETLRLSVNQMLDFYPDKEKLLREDKLLAELNGTPAGLTLMCYCVRWNRDGSRMLIHFGNHCVVKSRQEPKVTGIFTCKRDFSDLHLALNLENGGVHWSWHPDCEHLIGYYKWPEDNEAYLSIVRYDGSGLRKLCGATGGGHPSVSPADYNIAVTDKGENIDFWDLEKNQIIDSHVFPAKTSGKEIPGAGALRNESRVCHHPVFSRDGSHVIFNAFEGGLSRLIEVETPGGK